MHRSSRRSSAFAVFALVAAALASQALLIGSGSPSRPGDPSRASVLAKSHLSVVTKRTDRIGPAGNDDSALRSRAMESYGQLPLSFEKNEGQTDRRVEFISRGRDYATFLSHGGEAVLVLTGSSGPNRRPADRSLRAGLPGAGLSGIPYSDTEMDHETGAALRMKFVGANKQARGRGCDQLLGKVNYLWGADPKQWRSDIPTYAKVAYDDVYPGIDVVYYGNQRQLEYDFILGPGADPQVITLDVEGADRLEIDKSGDLVMHVGSRRVLQRKPVIYQKVDGVRKEIPGSYVLTNTQQVGFQIAAHDASQPLIIDPVLVYSTYLGGANQDEGLGIALDAAGNAFVTGLTASSNFPTTVGAFRTTFSSGFDAFVTKVNATGSALLYSTYLGGSNNDEGLGIAVDAAGNAYVTGFTASTNFPTTVGAFRTTLAFVDAFVTKLDPTGSVLVYSTYLGGSDRDEAFGIAVDAAGNAYVTGRTVSTDFPNTFGSRAASVGDAFVTKVDPTGSHLVYSRYVGGNFSDEAYAIAVDVMGNAYVTGFTASTNFPTTVGAFRTTQISTFDAFVTKLDPTGSVFVYSTYLGGNDNDHGNGIAVDSAGNAYITGITNSTNFPTTVGAFRTIYGGGIFDAFVTKLNPTGSALLYSTYLGGNSEDRGQGIAVDAMGNAYVTGFTSSTNFPTTVGAFRTTLSGSFDVFVTKFDSTGSVPVYSTYLGGSAGDQGFGIAVDAARNAYVTGLTNSRDFPTTAGAFQTTNPGGTVAFVTKLTEVAPPTTLTLSPSAATNAVGTTHTVTATVKDAFGNPTPSIVVRFSVTGTVTTTGSCTTNASGQCTFSYGSTTAGTDLISAFADNNNNGSQDVGEPNGAAAKAWTPGAPATLTLAPAAATNTVGTSHTVTATVTDAFGNPTPSIVVRFSVTGTVTTTGSCTTNASGQCTFSYGSTTAGTDLISAFADANNNGTTDAGEPSGAATKLWTPGAPATLILTPATATNAVGSQHCVTATVRDVFGNPISGVIVRFTVTGAVNTTGAAPTNGSGQTIFCYTGPALPGADAITAFADTNDNGSQNPGEPNGAATKSWVLPVTTPGCEILIIDNGRITAANGDTAIFHGNARASATGATSGNQRYEDRGPAQPLTVEAISVLAIVCGGTTQADIYGQATIDGSGSFSYRISVKDLGEPGNGTDTYSILLETGYSSGEQTLEAGNVQIRRIQ